MAWPLIRWVQSRQFAWGVALALFLSAASAASQPPRLILEASSDAITIIDGGDVRQGVLVANADPDVYVYHPSRASKRVSFVTDRQRADFDIAPGETRDFAVRFRGRLYNQRITGTNPNGVIYDGRATEAGGVDSLPFVLGPDNAIHVTGSINGSEPLDLIFDTGASLGVLSDRGRAKGAAVREGNANTIRVGTIGLSRAPMVHVDFGGSLRADGVIGFDAFAGKIVQIDYERRLLLISNTMPSELSGYRRTNLIWRGSASLVPVRMHTGSAEIETLALLDTGSKWSLSIGNQDQRAAQALRTLSSLGSRSASKSDGTRVSSSVVSVPWIELAGLRMPSVQADVEEEGRSSALPFNILGNDFLKRFNLIIDYRTSEVYLRPNSLAGEPYNQVWNLNLIFAAVALGFLIAGLGLLAIVRRRRRRSLFGS